MPVRGISPNDGLAPQTPQKLAGRTIDPAVCVPSATGTMPAATATAEPLELVPGVRVASHGLIVLPSVCTANSAVTVLPGTSAPARRRLNTARASLPGVKPCH